MKFDLPRLALVASAALALSGGYALAQDEETTKYSIEDVKACSADAMRLCKSKLPSVAAIEACMRAHFDQLRPKCQARFR